MRQRRIGGATVLVRAAVISATLVLGLGATALWDEQLLARPVVPARVDAAPAATAAAVPSNPSEFTPVTPVTPSAPVPVEPPVQPPPVAPAVLSAPEPTASPSLGLSAPALASGALAGRLVVIDPGHNGANGQHTAELRRQVDAGGFLKDCNTTGTATVHGYAESTFTWGLAGAVRHQLEALGARVELTRSTNSGWGPCVDERAAVANRLGADLLLSVHADGAPAGDRGFHVIEPGSVRGYTEDIQTASQAFAVSLRDALTVAGFRQSNYVGERGLITRTDLGTLNRSDVPAAMVECGNMRDPADAAVLVSAAGQERIATALTAGIVHALNGS